ncbi:MAG: hypothetical protein KA375_12155 [Vitreoscilla sp.]|nr:hypothetical protein [Vitreoscilla sp.]MBP6676433.1 hypothetical protein [Vitreoscilla sp.]
MAPPHCSGPLRLAAIRKTFIDTSNSIQVGKYLVSPLARHLGPDRYTASVSIRSGQGRSTHDRVLRLLPVFNDAPGALRYATEQGLAWLRDPAQYMQTGLQGQGN